MARSADCPDHSQGRCADRRSGRFRKHIAPTNPIPLEGTVRRPIRYHWKGRCADQSDTTGRDGAPTNPIPLEGTVRRPIRYHWKGRCADQSDTTGRDGAPTGGPGASENTVRRPAVQALQKTQCADRRSRRFRKHSAPTGGPRALASSVRRPTVQALPKHSAPTIRCHGRGPFADRRSRRFGKHGAPTGGPGASETQCQARPSRLW